MHTPFFRFGRRDGDAQGPRGPHPFFGHRGDGGHSPGDDHIGHGPHHGPHGHRGFRFGFDPRHEQAHCHEPRGGRGGPRRGPGGFGPRGGGGGDFDDLRDGRGGRGRGARALGHGDLRHLMLHLIAEQPRHGYELIRLIEQLFHGAYTPSAGAIYPTLAQLEDMGLIAATAEEGRKRYAITEEGRAHMQAAHEAIEAARMRTHHSAREFAKQQIPQPVREAFSRIKHAVLRRHGQWSEAEIARVAALLNQAADGMEEAP